LSWNATANTTYSLIWDGLSPQNVTSPVQVNFSINNVTWNLTSTIYVDATNSTDATIVNYSCVGWIQGIKNTPPSFPQSINAALLNNTVNFTFTQPADFDGENISNYLNGSSGLFNLTSGQSFVLPSYGTYNFTLCSTDALSWNCSASIGILYADLKPIFVSFNGPRDVLPFANRNLTQTYVLWVNSQGTTNATLNNRLCDLSYQDANNKSFSCYYDVNGLVAGVIPFNVVVTNSFNSVSATYNILRVGTLTYYSIQQPTFDFGSIYNDWIMVSQPLLVNNTGNYRFFGEDVRLASVVCNNINFNLSSVYFGPNANRASADSFEYDFYDLIVDSGETRNFYMFLYNPNRITPTNCRAKMNIGLLSEVD